MIKSKTSLFLLGILCLVFSTPGLVSGSVNIENVPYIHQTYDTAEDFDGRWACGAASTVMVTAYYEKLDIHPITCPNPVSHTNDYSYYVSNEYTNNYGYTYSRVAPSKNGVYAPGAFGYIHYPDGAASGSNAVDYLNQHDLDAWVIISPTESQVKAELDAGFPVIASTKLTTLGHWVVIKGYTDDGYYVVNDPWGNYPYDAHEIAGWGEFEGADVLYTWGEMKVGEKYAVFTQPKSVIEQNPPTVDDFSVYNSSVTLGNGFSIYYTVSDTGGSGLNRVEYWRKYEENEWQMTDEVSLVSEGNGPDEGSYTDTPDQVGTYWYGIHVADNAGNWNDEQNSHTDGLPGDFGTVEVTVRARASMELLWRFSTAGGIRDVRISTYGDYIATGSSDGSVFFIDKYGQPLWNYETNGWVLSLDMSDDGQYIVAGSDDSNIYVLDRDGNLKWTFEVEEGHRFFGIDTTPDGDFVAVGCSDKNVYFFSQNGSLLWTRQLGMYAGGVSVSHDGKYIAASGTFDNSTYLFDRAGNLLWIYSTNDEVFETFTSTDGAYVAFGSRDKNIYFLNRSGNKLWEYTTENQVKIVRISNDNKYVAAGTGVYIGSGPEKYYVYLLNTNGELLWKYPTLRNVGDVEISQDNKYVVVGSGDNNIYLFSIEGTLLGQYDTGNPVYSVSISRDGDYLAVGSEYEVFLFSIHKLRARALTVTSTHGTTTGEGTYPEGTTASFTVSPTQVEQDGERHTFSGWASTSPDGYNGPNIPAVVVMNGDVRQVAVWETEFYLSVSSEVGVEGEDWYAEGSTVDLNADSPRGFLIRKVFTEWSGDIESSSETVTVVMDEPKTVVAEWSTDYSQAYMVGGLSAALIVGRGVVSLLRRRREEEARAVAERRERIIGLVKGSGDVVVLGDVAKGLSVSEREVRTVIKEAVDAGLFVGRFSNDGRTFITDEILQRKVKDRLRVE